nr:hypothetical protein [Candidatus Sigynarchaeota archaeon]
ARNFSTSMIENHVKVIHMSYVIEQLRRDLDESNRLRKERDGMGYHGCKIDDPVAWMAGS